MKNTICLIRHGETNWNLEGRVQGRSDIPLNDTGINQAKTFANFLLKNHPNWDVILSSPLLRARQTANLIAKQLNYPNDIILFDSLMERDFGEIEGEVLNSTIFDMIIDEIINGMESRNDLSIRAAKTLMEISKQYPNKNILVVTHSHFIKGALYSLDNTFNFRVWLKNLSMNWFTVENEIITLDKFNI